MIVWLSSLRECWVFLVVESKTFFLVFCDEFFSDARDHAWFFFHEEVVFDAYAILFFDVVPWFYRERHVLLEGVV